MNRILGNSRGECRDQHLIGRISLVLGIMALGIGCAIVTNDPFARGKMNTDMDTHHERMLKHDMQAMAVSVRRLLVLSVEGIISPEERHTRVMRELDILQGIAEVTNVDSETYNYSVSSPYLGSFLHDISMAREFAQETPPDYQPATGLVNSCRFCHQNLSSL